MEPESSLPHSHVPILNHIDPAHAPTSHFLKVYLNNKLPSTSWSSNWIFLSGFPPIPCIRLSSPHTGYMPGPCHSSQFDHPNNIGEEYRSLSSSLCSFLHSPVTSSFLGQNTLLNTLFSNALCLRSSLYASDLVSHPYNTTAKL